MNCKPGDLAVIVREADRRHCADSVLGRFCTVLSAAPPTEFLLPDGRNHTAAPPGYWLIEFDSPVRALDILGELLAVTRFAVIGDFKLRPIRDNPGQDQTLTWAGLPVTTKEEVA